MTERSTQNQQIEKLKAIFMLGLQSNFPTLVGIVVIWIFLAKTGWMTGFWDIIFLVLSFVPTLMGDAINNYGLGRIKLEAQKGWEDVQISNAGKEIVTRYFAFWRAISILSAALFIAVLLAPLGATQEVQHNLKILFLVGFALHFLRSSIFLQKFFAPKVPAFGGKYLAYRTFAIGMVFAIWYFYLWTREIGVFSNWSILGQGILYFLLCAFLHPMPTRYSILRPGSLPRKRVFFTVEKILEDTPKLPGWGEIEGKCKAWEKTLGFNFLANLKIPLIELPLFGAWGKSFMSQEKTELLVCIQTEVKKSTFRYLFSWSESQIFITTDFGAPAAKFPEEIIYQSINKSFTDEDFLNTHREFASNIIEQNEHEVCDKLEQLIKRMISFLESNSISRENQEKKCASKIDNETISTGDSN